MITERLAERTDNRGWLIGLLTEGANNSVGLAERTDNRGAGRED